MSEDRLEKSLKNLESGIRALEEKFWSMTPFGVAPGNILRLAREQNTKVSHSKARDTEDSNCARTGFVSWPSEFESHDGVTSNVKYGEARKTPLVKNCGNKNTKLYTEPSDFIQPDSHQELKMHRPVSRRESDTNAIFMKESSACHLSKWKRSILD